MSNIENFIELLLILFKKNPLRIIKKDIKKIFKKGNKERV